METDLAKLFQRYPEWIELDPPPTELMSINTRFADGESLLHIACTFGLKHDVETLINAGADVNAVDYDNTTPLYSESVHKIGSLFQ